MAQQKTRKGKGSYAEYKTDNRAVKNKIKKLVRHCKKFPNDEVGKANLERIKTQGYTPRSKPLVPGSNPTVKKIKGSNELGYLYGPKTAGEQLSKLLGIPLPKVRTRSFKRKAAVRVKKSKDVNKP